VSAVYADEPVTFSVEPALTGRSRVTTFFRLFLAIPHFFFAGAIASVVFWLGVFSWFTLLFAGRMPRGTVWVQQHALTYLAGANAYVCLLRDEYPPFWEGPYPLTAEFREGGPPRNRVTVFFRLFLLIPLLIWLVLVGIAAAFVILFAWFTIVFAARLPQNFGAFIEGYIRLYMRIYWYSVLGTDRYPSFGLGGETPPTTPVTPPIPQA
jgi:hypothetical protein